MSDGTVNGAAFKIVQSEAGQAAQGSGAGILSLMNTVLLIEDDALIVDLLKEVLDSRGYEVLVAANADDGLRHFREHYQNTLCIVLDYEIPGMHAKRLLERLTAIDPGVRVILSSGYPQGYVSREFPVDRLAGYLSKPYDPQLLILELQRLAGRQAA